MDSVRRFGVVLLIAASSSLSPAATIRSLSVTGNAAFTAREISGWLESRTGGTYLPWTMQADLRRIEELYREQGYLGARAGVESPAGNNDSSFLDLTIHIVEGRQTLVGRIAETGSVALTESEILERFDMTPGSPMNERLLERDIDALLSLYERWGYPFTRCDVADMVYHEGPVVDSVDVLLKIIEGRLLTVDEIRIEGNRETDPGVIVRETRIEPGETFNPAKVDAIRLRLNRLNIFSSVGEPELFVRENRGGLLIRVVEGNTSTFDGVLGYIPSSIPGESGYLTGLATVSMRNLFGTGRKLDLRWQREDRSSQEIGVRYIEPWVFQAPVNLEGGFFQRQQDTSFVRRTLNLKAELMLSEALSLSVVFTTERVIPTGDSTASAVIGTTSTTGGVEVLYDTRDDMINPTSGARYRTDYHYGRKSAESNLSPAAAGVSTGGTVRKIGVDLEFYLATFRRQVVGVGVHGREVRTGGIQESDMFRFGGANTLRGYRENQFLGSLVVWTNTEYRFILARRSFMYGFIDTGYFSRPAEEVLGLPSSEGFRYGYGIGIRLDTPLGNIGVSFALGQGDSFGTGKVHIGLINEF